MYHSSNTDHISLARTLLHPRITNAQSSGTSSYTIDSSCRWSLPRAFSDKLLAGSGLFGSSNSKDDDGGSSESRATDSSGDFSSSLSGLSRTGADARCVGLPWSSGSVDACCSGPSSATSSSPDSRSLGRRLLVRRERNFGTYTVVGPGNYNWHLSEFTAGDRLADNNAL